MHVSSPFEEAEESIDKSVLIDLGLIIGKDARRDNASRTSDSV
jgi:ribonuclease M5